MRLTRSQLRLIQEGLDMVISESALTLEYENDEAILRWATETIEEAEAIYDKLNIVIDTITKLAERSCDADIILTPSITTS